jgi:hypothetical protein
MGTKASICLNLKLLPFSDIEQVLVSTYDHDTPYQNAFHHYSNSAETGTE